ncbi:HAD family hydrolase [Streptomyces sp. NBC_01275]|uniref:HAD family hydrolase n=1 Tax=Streptomyces sp. NBC_01275 TaxID=2903807 RepID=UPI002252669E|nr:HAD family hydrolase [Streptomyces sp. NBC_01275]MCX4762199.1 HAD family hydrolase [Streptomyces sp. NBC_01275]
MMRSAYPWPVRKFQAIVFDFDGVILDTETTLFQSWVALFEYYGCPPPSLTEWARQLGTSERPNLLAELAGSSKVRIDEQEATRRRVALSKELIRRQSVQPGIAEWLNEARRHRYPVAVASSSPISWVSGHLQRLDLADYFSTLVCCDADIRSKPTPDSYLRACRDLGVDPMHALAVEDSPNGIAAAKTAGLSCIAVPNSMTAGLDLAEADLVVPSLADLSISDVVKQLEERRAKP